MSPVSYVVGLIGGVRATARVINRAPSSVSRWNETIPTAHHKTILAYAKKKNLDITPTDLVYGRTVKNGMALARQLSNRALDA